MRNASRVLMIAALSWFAWVLLQNVHTLPTVDENGVAIPEAQMKVLLYFAGIVLLATGIGVCVALTIVPILGDKIASYLLGFSNASIEADPHAAARACLVDENYGEAISAYFKAYRKNPQDAHALSEIASIYCNHLQDSVAACATLEEAFKREWPAQEEIFLKNRLVDIYWNHQRDATRACCLLLEITKLHPGSHHAAQARNRCLEIERQVENV